MDKYKLFYKFNISLPLVDQVFSYIFTLSELYNMGKYHLLVKRSQKYEKSINGYIKKCEFFTVVSKLAKIKRWDIILQIKEFLDEQDQIDNLINEDIKKQITSLPYRIEFTRFGALIVSTSIWITALLQLDLKMSKICLQDRTYLLQTHKIDKQKLLNIVRENGSTEMVEWLSSKIN